MAVGKTIENRGHVVGFGEEIGLAAKEGRDSFFTWFHGGADADTAFVRGQWDMALHILRPLAPYIREPESRTVLEIGHGGGRLLAAASRCFAAATGVDVHDNNELVLQELAARGIKNATLVKGDGQSLPLPSDSFDVVYSFVVLQHVERVAVFDRYVTEAYRVMKPGGVGILYFGRWCHFSKNRSAACLYLLDRLAAGLRLWPRGYREIPARVNEINLLISPARAARVARGAGFRIQGIGVSRRSIPDGLSLYGGQHSLLVRKD